MRSDVHSATLPERSATPNPERHFAKRPPGERLRESPMSSSVLQVFASNELPYGHLAPPGPLHDFSPSASVHRRLLCASHSRLASAKPTLAVGAVPRLFGYSKMSMQNPPTSTELSAF